MKDLSINEIHQVSGGLTENQCIGLMTLGGGAIGAMVGGAPGAGLGLGLGGALGMFYCGSWTGGGGGGSGIFSAMRF